MIIKRMTQMLDHKLIRLKEYINHNKNLEISANLLEINLAVLTNQLNDSRINELFAMIKTHNWNLRENNDLLMKNISFSSEYDKLFNTIEKINNNIEILISYEKKNAKLTDNFAKNIKN